MAVKTKNHAYIFLHEKVGKKWKPRQFKITKGEAWILIRMLLMDKTFQKEIISMFVYEAIQMVIWKLDKTTLENIMMNYAQNLQKQDMQG